MMMTNFHVFSTNSCGIQNLVVQIIILHTNFVYYEIKEQENSEKTYIDKDMSTILYDIF